MKNSIQKPSFSDSQRKPLDLQGFNKNFFLKIKKGFEKGTVFKLSGPEIMIGRDPSNHVQLKKDTKVSRHHAQIYWKKNQYAIKNITKNNTVCVNGISIHETRLRGDELIQVGSYELQFIVFDNSLANVNGKKSKSQGSFYKLVIIAFIVGMAWISLTGLPTQRSLSSSEIYETEEVAQRRIESIEETIDYLGEKIKTSNSYRAQSLGVESMYIRGKRDFDRSQFFYAQDAFRAVLSIDPKHFKARRMLRLSIQYADNLLERHFKEGIANRDAGRYEICKSSMKNVMNLIDDPKTQRYIEAKKILIECNLHKMGAY